MFPRILCAVLSIAVIILVLKIYTVQRALKEISTQLGEHLSADTNKLLTVSFGDKHIRRLAAALNEDLKVLRSQRRKYMQGDQELKEAVTNISHDLRTPLTAISGYLELLKQEEKSEAVAGYLSFIENRTETMKSLTEELFRYAVALSAGKMKLEPLDIRSVLEESLLDFHGEMTKKGISPSLSITEHPVIRRLNRPALSRIFSNILQNALKYSDGDLSVTLSETGEILFCNAASSLDQVQVKKLFHRFFTVENARNSTGLGLSIAKMLAEEMQGNIAAEYQNGKLRIRVSFPNAASPHMICDI